MKVEQMALLIPILMIVLGVAVAVVAIVASHREKQKRVELRHRERIAAIEKGIELAPDPEGEVKKSSSLKSGLSALLIGVVLYFALDRVADEDVALFGLIPAAFGIASLISYFVEGRRKSNGR